MCREYKTALLSKFRAVGASIVLVVILLGYTAVVAITVGPAIDRHTTPALTFVVVTLVSYAGFFLIGRLYSCWDGRLRLTFKPAYKRVPGKGTVFLFAAVVCSGASITALSSPDIMTSHFYSEVIGPDQITASMIGVVLVIIAPAIEEYVFRGLIQQRLGRAFSDRSAIIIASILFILLHVGEYGSVGALLVALSMIFLLSVVVGTLYSWTGSLLLPATAHALYNAVVYVGFVFEIWSRTSGTV